MTQEGKRQMDARNIIDTNPFVEGLEAIDRSLQARPQRIRQIDR